jgi:GTP-binding protein HflX
VGFIQKLSPAVVAAFRATLEELSQSDVLLHVIDVTHPKSSEQTEVVEETLEDLGLLGKPRLLVLNKMDLLPEKTDVEDSAVLLGPDQPGSDRLGSDRLPNVLISAAKRWNFDNLLEQIESQLMDLDGPLTVSQPAAGRSRLLNG